MYGLVIMDLPEVDWVVDAEVEGDPPGALPFIGHRRHPDWMRDHWRACHMHVQALLMQLDRCVVGSTLHTCVVSELVEYAPGSISLQGLIIALANVMDEDVDEDEEEEDEEDLDIDVDAEEEEEDLDIDVDAEEEEEDEEEDEEEEDEEDVCVTEPVRKRRRLT